MKRIALVLVSALLVTSSRRALANGRFPQATQLVVDPSNPARIVVRTTFGLLSSVDAGATWRWICEEQVGFSGTFDPAIAIAGDGSLLAGLPDGLSHTQTGGCKWARSLALGKEWIVDLAVDRREPGHVIAVNAPIDLGLPGFQAFLAHSRDDGLTWSFAAGRLPEDLAPTTVELAPSRPERVYAAGVGAFKAFAVVARSDDAGATWAEASFDMRGATAPYVAAVAPDDPDRVWLRLDSIGPHALLFSADGGRRFDQVLEAPELLGFALSPDGARVAVGGPSSGLSVASTADRVFAKTSATRVRCLTWTKEGLWACGDDAADGFAIGLSVDGGKTFTPKLRLADLQPLGCVREVCAKAWANVSAQIAPPKDAGVIDAATPDAPAPTSAPRASGGGCGCGTGRRADASSPWAAALAALAALRRRRGRSG